MELRLGMKQLSPAAILLQSPTSPIQLDPKFVLKHNAMAIEYQTFKDDIDAFLSDQMPAGPQQTFIFRILVKGTRLIMAIEAEKQFLINDVLCKWAVQQQKMSVATQYSQQMNYQLLNAIDTQFEYFGELLEQTLSTMGILVAKFPGVGFEQQHQQIRQLTHLFLYYSVIVSRQPPAVVVKCNEAESHMRSRFWFNTEIRVMGGRAFGFGRCCSNHNVQIKCHVITDEAAKQLYINAWHEVADDEMFAVEPAVAVLNLLDGPLLVADTEVGPTLMAKFNDMRVVKKWPLRRDDAYAKRYHLCYSIRLHTVKHQIDLVGKKVESAVTSICHFGGPQVGRRGPAVHGEVILQLCPPSERGTAVAGERPGASECARDEISSLNQSISLINSMTIQSILEMPTNPAYQFGLTKPLAFSAVSRKHLLNRLKPNALGQVPLDNFLKMPAFGEFCVTAQMHSGAQKPLSTTLSAVDTVPEGEWELISPAEMVNKHFLQMWNDGLILGFCGKEEAEHLLAQCQRPTLLIHFSYNELAKVMISVHDQLGVVRHYLYDQSELQDRSLDQELLQNLRYKDIEFIWPQTSLECAIEVRKHSLSNQDAGMDSQGSADGV